MGAYDNLKNAIVAQAAEDYAAAFMGNKVAKKEPGSMMRECEIFFHSDWYTDLTNGEIDGDWLAKEIKIRELEKAEKVYMEMLNICNRVMFRATVYYPKKNGEKKPMTYIFPPRLADGIMDTLRLQLETIRLQREAIRGGQEQAEGGDA